MKLTCRSCWECFFVNVREWLRVCWHLRKVYTQGLMLQPKIVRVSCQEHQRACRMEDVAETKSEDLRP